MNTRSCLQLLLSVLLFLMLGVVANAQTRDHLTPQEVELVQESQILDKRTEVFIKAIERRMLVLNGTQAGNTKQLQKDSDKWGELPKGTRAELIGDITKILDEAITNIDDVGFHDEKNPLLPKALRKLAAAAEQISAQLRPIGKQAKTDDEISSVEQAMENAQSIIDAARKLPAEVEPEKGKGKTKKAKEKP
jgi:hypothetical protein